MSQRYLSGTNGFVPEATGQVISFVRDPASFKINNYVQNIMAPAPVGLYAVLDRDRPARVVSDAEFTWEDGDERPMGRANIGRFQWVEFRCYRRDYAFALGNQAVETAKGWKPLMYEAGSAAQQAMTNRTNRIVSMLDTAANWPAANTAAANTLNGGFGKFDTASGDVTSVNYLAIKRCILGAMQVINLQTNGLVQPADLVMVVSPGLAVKMAETSEIHDYLARSPFAMAQLRGEEPNVNQAWGLPSILYGIRIIVEDAVRVSTRPNAVLDTTSTTGGTGTRLYAKSDDTAVIISQKGGLDGAYGAPSFSTVQCYFYKHELQVQTFQDARNERVDGHVVEQFAEKLAAPSAGYLIQDCLT